MTNNHLELCGIQTFLRNKVYDLNMAIREGTMEDIVDTLAKIEVEAREARYIAERLADGG